MLGTIIGGAAGAVGGILGGLGKNRALKKQINAIKGQQAENQNWYDQRYNEDATQRADAQRILTLTAERMKNRNRAAAGTAAVMGGSTESIAAEKAANAGALADAASQIAVAGAQRKDQIENQYIDRKNELQGQINQLDAQKQGAFDIAAGAIGGAAAGVQKGLGFDGAYKRLKG